MVKSLRVVLSAACGGVVYFVMDQPSVMRPDYMRAVNPTPYKVAVSEALYRSMHDIWMQEAPISEIT